MISLYDYKEYIINYCDYEIDNNEEKINQRCIELLGKYSDSYLRKIIDDTYDFISEMPLEDIMERGYYTYDLDRDTTSYISLNITGAGVADTIFTDAEGRLISKYILRKKFGDSLVVYVKEEEVPSNTKDKKLVSYDGDYSLYMQGFQNVFENDYKKSLIK